MPRFVFWVYLCLNTAGLSCCHVFGVVFGVVFRGVRVPAFAARGVTGAGRSGPRPPAFWSGPSAGGRREALRGSEEGFTVVLRLFPVASYTL